MDPLIEAHDLRVNYGDSIVPAVEPPARRAPVPGMTPVDLAPTLDAIERGESVIPAPSIGQVEKSQHGLLYEASITSIAAEAGVGKSWLGLALARDVIRRGKVALFIDAEEVLARRVERMIDLGVDRKDLTEGFRYVQAEVPITFEVLEPILDGVGLLVIDSVGNAMGLARLSQLDDDHVMTFFQELRKISRRGIPIVVLDHRQKDRKSQGKEPFGSVKKYQEVDLQLMAEAESNFARGRSGRLSLTVTKDRLGHHGVGTEFEVLVNATGDVVDIRFQGGARGDYLPTDRMKTVATLVEKRPGITATELRDRADGKGTTTDWARDLLIQNGYIKSVIEGRKTKFYPLKKFGPETASLTPGTGGTDTKSGGQERGIG